MAKATRVTKEVTRTIVDKVPNGVNLHLTEKEASVLLALVGKIVGPCSAGDARTELDKVYYSLNGLVTKAELKHIENIWIESK